MTIHTEPYEGQALMSDILAEFDQALDDAHGTIYVAGIGFTASRILRAVDTAAYRAKFDEWNHYVRDVEVDTDELIMDADFPS